MPLTDGQLIRPIGGLGSVYLNANGVKYHIENPDTMTACNLSWGKINEKA